MKWWLSWTEADQSGWQLVSISRPVYVSLSFSLSVSAFVLYSYLVLKVKVKVAQSCPILCDPMDCTVHRTLQARILEWVAFPFSRASSLPRDRTHDSIIFPPSGPFGFLYNTMVSGRWECLPSDPRLQEAVL